MTTSAGLPVTVCSKCGTYQTDVLTFWRCDCGGVLELEPAGDPFEAVTDRLSPSMWRFAASLHLSDLEHRVSLGEGLTPIVDAHWKNRRASFKLDYLAPTGSYKDRGASALVSVLLSAGATSIVEDSSGNAGASIAAYSARAGIKCQIYVPASNSSGKRSQIRAYGASMVEIDGTRQDVAEACEAEAAKGDSVYAAHNWSPFFLESFKSIAYEIFEQRKDAMPEWVVAPAGYGSVALGLYRGFKDLVQWGYLDAIPRLAFVQARNCAPIFEAFQAGRQDVAGGDREDRGAATLAEGIECPRPIRSAEMLYAVEESCGTVLAVTEEEISSCSKELAEIGLYVEPTSAVVAAGISQLDLRHVDRDAPPVLGILTGTGLKKGVVE